MEGFVVGWASEIAKAALTAAAKKAYQEASLIFSSEGSFRDFQARLDDQHCSLREANRDQGRQEFRHSITRLLRELESAALEAQDVIELCVVKGLVPTASSRPCPWASCFNDLLAACFGMVQFIHSIPATYNMAVQIKEMNTILDNIQKRVQSVATWSVLSPISSSSNLENVLNRGELIYKEETAVDVIPKIQVIEGLIDQNRDVAVVGMAGSGKTHLRCHVFKSIKSRYDVAVWLTVSCTFTVEQLQLNVLAQLREQPHLEASEVKILKPRGEGTDVLEAKIHNALTNRKYLIVFDDVWEWQGNGQAPARNVMERLKNVGVLEHDLRTVWVSTRNCEVASQIGAHVYEMPLLSDEHSRDLLFKHLLPHSQVEQLQVNGNVEAKAIDTALQRCGGVPLAVIAVAGLLKHQTPDKWAKSVQDFLSLSSQQNVVTTALMLSFNDLDYMVKPCFVMLGLFAEDEEINAENMIGMWSAEGHITSHEEGICILKHLCNRCLLEMHLSKGLSILRITIHDLVPDLAVRLCKEHGGICEASHYTEDVLQQELWSRKGISRISLSKAGISCIPNKVAFPRSLHALRLDHKEKLSKIPSKSLAAAVALRTLDISGTDIASLPECIGNFLLLKYLDIRCEGIKKLPECLRNLKLLKYLYTCIKEDVPQWIGDLESLAFFEADRAEWVKIDKIPRNLERLRGVQMQIRSKGNNNNNNEGEGEGEGDRKWLWTWHSFSELTKLEVLEDLHIGEGFKEGCMPPPNIVCLALKNTSSDEELTLPNEWQCCPPGLQRLTMKGIKFPDELHGFKKLSVLFLRGSGVYSKVISDLPELENLTLSFDKTCESLPDEYGRPGAFPKLRVLKILTFLKLRKLPNIEHGGMPCLSALRLVGCPRLSEGCGWIQKVATLSTLAVRSINDDFKAELKAAYNSEK